MKIIKAIIRGCGYVEGYGEHPGTGMLILLIGMGAIAGLKRSLLWAIFGSLVMAIVFVPIYLYGAYERGKRP